MGNVGIVTGGGRGMGLSCAERMVGTVDTLLLVDIDETSAKEAAARLSSDRTVVESFVADVGDAEALGRLADRAAELGNLRSVAHAAGISPTMADWRRIVSVDLVGTALLAHTLRPLATAGTAMVYFASMAPLIGGWIRTRNWVQSWMIRSMNISSTGSARSWANRSSNRVSPTRGRSTVCSDSRVRKHPARCRWSTCELRVAGADRYSAGRQEAASNPRIAIDE